MTSWAPVVWAAAAPAAPAQGGEDAVAGRGFGAGQFGMAVQFAAEFAGRGEFGLEGLPEVVHPQPPIPYSRTAFSRPINPATRAASAGDHSPSATNPPRTDVIARRQRAAPR